MIKKIIIIISAVVILIVGVFAGAKLVPLLSKTDKSLPVMNPDEQIKVENGMATVDVQTVEKIIEATSELVVTNYSYKDIYQYEKSVEKLGVKIPFSTNQFIISYSGTVKGGIDFSKIKCDINNSDKTITLKIPKPYIISHEIDENSIEYFDIKKSLFEKYSLSNYAKLIADLKSKKNNELLNNEEFLSSVKESSQNIIKGFLSNSEATKEYTIIFK